MVHLNLHKTFSTPHGGGGPGSTVGRKKHLIPYLPTPRIVERIFAFDEKSDKASAGSELTAISLLCTSACLHDDPGSEGLKNASENAVLNANYMLHMLKDTFDIPETGAACTSLSFHLRLKKEKSVSALDLPRRFLTAASIRLQCISC